MKILPIHIPVPLETAQACRFDGDLAAHDIALAIAVGHLAAMAEPFDEGRVPLADNDLRAALGVHRRDTVERENRRFERLQAGTMATAITGAVPLPTVPFRTLTSGESIPHRNAGDGTLTWIVDPLFRARFAPGGEFVMLPIEALSGCRNRHSVTVLLRLLAAMYTGGRKVRKSGPGFMLLEIDAKDIADALGIPPSSKPSRILPDYLQPIADDVTSNSGIRLEFEPIYAQTSSSPKGKLWKFHILLTMAEESELERRLRAQEAQAKKATARTWRDKPAPPVKPAPTIEPGPAMAAPRLNNITILSGFRRPFGRPAVRPSTGPDKGEVSF